MPWVRAGQSGTCATGRPGAHEDGCGQTRAHRETDQTRNRSTGDTGGRFKRGERGGAREAPATRLGVTTQARREGREWPRTSVSAVWSQD